MTVCSIIGIISLGVRIGLSYLLKPIFGERTIAFAEGFAWILMFAMFLLQIIRKFSTAKRSGTAL